MDTDLARYIEESFPTALENGTIQVYYQPVIRTISRKLCSFEALARWIEPRRGPIFPDQFIPVLEQARLIHLLDSFVVRSACAVIRRAVERGEVPIPISVNLSRLDFVLCDIFEVVNNAVNEYKIPRDFLYIEITESLMAEQGGGMQDVIDRFRSAGFQVWMDDFGSGYSSLNVLKDFSFNEIKLDMQFLSSFDQRSRRIMTSVIQMAKEISIHTLAEGVETEEQFNYLRNIGCEKVQGYYFGRPAPYEESLAHLADIGVEVERPAERTYYDRIGQVDFLSAVPFMTQEEKDALTTARHLNSIPLAVAEARADSFSVLFYNVAFEETARSTGLISNIFTQEMLRMPQPYSLLPTRIINLMDSTRSGEEGHMIFISNEEYYEIQAKCIAQTKDAYCVLFRMNNLSKASKSQKTDRLDDSLRQLYAMFERITLVDAESDTIMPLYTATREDLVSGRKGIRELNREYAERLIFPEDRDDYLAFSDLSTVDRRIAETGDQSVTTTLRSSVRHGQYAWKQYTIMSLRSNTYLELIRNVDREVAEFVSRTNARPHGFTAADQEFPEELVWRRLLDSGLVRLFWKDEDRRFLGASQSFLDYYGFGSVDDIRGKNDEDLGWHVQPGHFQNDEMSVIHEGVTTHNEPGQCMRDGEMRDILASKTPLYDEDGRIRGLLGFFLDKAMLEDNDVRGEETKRRDLLTGLLNSRGLHEESRTFRDEYHLRGVDFVRINVGIDDIDAINNQYGFDFGDKAIAELGKSLKRMYGVTALVGRLSGQQFAIICQMHETGEDTRLRELAKQAADKVRTIDDVHITLYTSVGSCRFSEVESLEEQAKRAEVRRLADQNEHTNIAKRQTRASAIFQVYDNLPIAYSVYKVLLDDEGNACDATIFYVNHEFERRSEMTSAEMLGKSTRELFPSMEPEWYDKIRRAAFFGEVITDKLFFEPDQRTYYMTVSQVIHSGYCCCTYQKI